MVGSLDLEADEVGDDLFGFVEDGGILRAADTVVQVVAVVPDQQEGPAGRDRGGRVAKHDRTLCFGDLQVRDHDEIERVCGQGVGREIRNVEAGVRRAAFGRERTRLVDPDRAPVESEGVPAGLGEPDRIATLATGEVDGPPGSKTGALLGDEPIGACTPHQFAGFVAGIPVACVHALDDTRPSRRHPPSDPLQTVGGPHRRVFTNVTPMSDSAVPTRDAPAPGQAPLVAPNAAALLRRNATDPAIRDRVAIRFGDRAWTHREYYEESCRFAQLFITRLPEGAPRHVAVLLDNTPDYLFAFGGAALIGGAVVGLNHTRRGEHLAHDARHTDCGLVITEPRHEALLADIVADLPPILVSDRHDDGAATLGEPLSAALGAVGTDDPGIEPDVDSIWALIFTSGTSDAPKAVICTQRRLLVTGNRMAILLGLGPDDCGYVCMPLFHSNAIQVGWAPSIVIGCGVGLGRKFSASGWLPDVRRYGSTYFNYTGKPLAYLLATPEHADDAENAVRIAFGNEGSPEVVAEFSRRFGIEVIDAYGATEGGIAVNRDATTPPTALGRPAATVLVVDEQGEQLPRAVFDAEGRLANAQECVGEIVNTAGVGPFEGYYKNDDATQKTARFGWYWSGDLGYVDDDGFLYFAGRNADWIRVDGENFTAAPIEEALRKAPGLILSSVYGVPDAAAGDQAMAGLVLVDPDAFDGAAFAQWLDAQTAIGPKWRPRYVRVLREPPTTGTNKIVKRTLQHQKWRADRCDGDSVWIRERGDAAYRPFTAADEAALRAEFVHHGRERFWDL